MGPFGGEIIYILQQTITQILCFRSQAEQVVICFRFGHNLLYLWLIINAHQIVKCPTSNLCFRILHVIYRADPVIHLSAQSFYILIKGNAEIPEVLRLIVYDECNTRHENLVRLRFLFQNRYMLLIIASPLQYIQHQRALEKA